ncbi:MAG: hypothetical protein IH571_06855 [Acholeplasmataceae bacterium]|nr:hypothetical protein [Acholeplasmataceae bacterium]
MKQKVHIFDGNDRTIFYGKPIAMPIKKESIISMCISLYSDPDPCIIHQSYATQKLVDRFLSIFQNKNVNGVSLMAYKEQLSFIDIDHIEKFYLSIEVKK